MSRYSSIYVNMISRNVFTTSTFIFKSSGSYSIMVSIKYVASLIYLHQTPASGIPPSSRMPSLSRIPPSSSRLPASSCLCTCTLDLQAPCGAPATYECLDKACRGENFLCSKHNKEAHLCRPVHVRVKVSDESDEG